MLESYECESQTKFHTISANLSGQVLHDIEKGSYFPDTATTDYHIPFEITSQGLFLHIKVSNLFCRAGATNFKI